MEDLLQAIFSNGFIVIAIIAGIMSKINQNKKQAQEKRKKAPVKPKPTVAESTRTEQATGSTRYQSTKELAEMRRKKMREMQTTVQSAHNMEQKDTIPIETKQDESFVSTHTEASHNAIPDHPTLQTHLKDTREKPQVSIKKQLTKKRVIENIIMAEVLGPPRAKKPYRSILNQNKD